MANTPFLPIESAQEREAKKLAQKQQNRKLAQDNFVRPLTSQSLGDEYPGEARRRWTTEESFPHLAEMPTDERQARVLDRQDVRDIRRLAAPTDEQKTRKVPTLRKRNIDPNSVRRIGRDISIRDEDSMLSGISGRESRWNLSNRFYPFGDITEGVHEGLPTHIAGTHEEQRQYDKWLIDTTVKSMREYADNAEKLLSGQPGGEIKDIMPPAGERDEPVERIKALTMQSADTRELKGSIAQMRTMSTVLEKTTSGKLGETLYAAELIPQILARLFTSLPLLANDALLNPAGALGKNQMTRTIEGVREFREKYKRAPDWQDVMDIWKTAQAREGMPIWVQEWIGRPLGEAAFPVGFLPAEKAAVGAAKAGVGAAKAATKGGVRGLENYVAGFPGGADVLLAMRGAPTIAGAAPKKVKESLDLSTAAGLNRDTELAGQQMGRLLNQIQKLKAKQHPLIGKSKITTEELETLKRLEGNYDILADQRSGNKSLVDSHMEAFSSKKNYKGWRNALGELQEAKEHLALLQEENALIQKPRWATGLTVDQLKNIAKQEGGEEPLNIYKSDWWDSIDSKVIKEARQGAYRSSAGKAVNVTQLKNNVRGAKQVVEWYIRKADDAMYKETGRKRPVPAIPASLEEHLGFRLGQQLDPEVRALNIPEPEIGQGQLGFGIGEKIPPPEMLGEYQGRGGSRLLADPSNLAARQARAEALARGQGDIFAEAVEQEGIYQGRPIRYTGTTSKVDGEVFYDVVFTNTDTPGRIPQAPAAVEQSILQAPAFRPGRISLATERANISMALKKQIERGSHSYWDYKNNIPPVARGDIVVAGPLNDPAITVDTLPEGSFLIVDQRQGSILTGSINDTAELGRLDSKNQAIIARAVEDIIDEPDLPVGATDRQLIEQAKIDARAASAEVPTTTRRAPAEPVPTSLGARQEPFAPPGPEQIDIFTPAETPAFQEAMYEGRLVRYTGEREGALYKVINLATGEMETIPTPPITTGGGIKPTPFVKGVGEPVVAAKGMSYRGFSRPEEAVGSDKLSSQSIMALDDAYGIEFSPPGGVVTPATGGGVLRNISSENVTKVFFNPDKWPESARIDRIAEDLPVMHNMFPNAEFVQVMPARDNPENLVIKPRAPAETVPPSVGATQPGLELEGVALDPSVPRPQAITKYIEKLEEQKSGLGNTDDDKILSRAITKQLKQLKRKRDPATQPAPTPKPGAAPTKYEINPTPGGIDSKWTVEAFLDDIAANPGRAFTNEQIQFQANNAASIAAELNLRAAAPGITSRTTKTIDGVTKYFVNDKPVSKATYTKAAQEAKRTAPTPKPGAAAVKEATKIPGVDPAPTIGQQRKIAGVVVKLHDIAEYPGGRSEIWTAVDETDGASRVRVVSEGPADPIIKRFDSIDAAQEFFDDTVQAFGKKAPPKSAVETLTDPAFGEPPIDTPPTAAGAGGDKGPPKMPRFGDDADEIPDIPFDESAYNAVMAKIIKAISESKVTAKIKTGMQSEERKKRVAMAHEAAIRGDIKGIYAAHAGELVDEDTAAFLDRVGGTFTDAEHELLQRKILQHFTENRDLIRKHEDSGRMIDSYGFMQTGHALNKLLATGNIPTLRELELLKSAFGPEFTKSILKHTTYGGKRGWQLLIEAFNIPRTILASGDISASLRQGFPFILRDGGKIYWNALKAQVHALRSEDVARAAELAIKTDPLYELSQRGVKTQRWPGASDTLADPDKPAFKLHKLDMPGLSSDIQIGGLGGRAEPFLGARLIEQPWKMTIGGKTINVNPLEKTLGKFVTRPSERAYTTMLNKLRFGTFKYEFNKLPPDLATTNPEKYMTELGHIIDNINIMSGRGTVGLGDMGAALNGIFFSPRFAISRLQMPLSVLIGTGDSRKMAIKMIGSWIGSVGGAMLLMEAAGIGEVEKNPRSSDFMKFKIGNTRIDPWGGLQPVVVMTMRIITGKTKSITTKEIRDMDAKEAVSNFLFNKLTPSTRFMAERGESWGGEGPLEPSQIPHVPNAVFDNFVFMWVQDTFEVAESYGWLKAIPAAALSNLGMGVSTFGDVSMTTQSDFAESEYAKKYDLLLGYVGPSIRMNGEDVELTNDQRETLQQRTFDLVNEELNNEVGTVRFSRANETGRQELMEKALARGRENARDELRKELEGITSPTRGARGRSTRESTGTPSTPSRTPTQLTRPKRNIDPNSIRRIGREPVGVR